VWLPKPVQEILGELSVFHETHLPGYVLSGPRGRPISMLDAAMRRICTELHIERITRHDLRRTHGTAITRLGFGRDAMNRIQNHHEGGIASVYDQHQYASENQHIMEAVARHILDIVEGRVSSNVVTFGKR
jgi:hypothetical protein